jgi:membrane protease YdiL (CAAX protease family)
MLFLLKKTVPGALAALAVLAALGAGLRWLTPFDLPSLWPSWRAVPIGLAVCGVMLASDALIHVALRRSFGGAYLRLFHELAGEFRGQGVAAMIAGAMMAGVGEELAFRGWSTSLSILLPLAVSFGLLHHIRGRLWPFTLWSMWEGVLFALALWWTRELAVTMTAHFFHDVLGFVIFRAENRRQGGRLSPQG